jgi:hypothetical protein
MSELNNWLLHQEGEEWERFKAEKGDRRQTKAAMLAGLGLAASLGVVAAKSDEAKADTQGQEVHDLLLCTCDSGDNPVETVVTDPKSLDYNSYPSSWDDPENILSASAPRFWNGYVFKPFSNYVTQTSGWRIFKMVNGEEIEAGQLPDVISGYMDVISQNAGLINGSDGNFYRLIDMGNTVAIELVGESPLMPDFSYGGYLFSKYSVYGSPTHDEEAVVMDEDNPTEIASVLMIATGGTSFNNTGCDVDKQTGELVMTAQNGYRVAQLPPLVDGKLPPDFSLSDLTFSPIIPLGSQIIDKAIAGYGYKYFFSGSSNEIVIKTPDNKKQVISGSQLGMTNISGVIGLGGGGIYVIADDSFNQPPVSLIPTTDPAKFIAPGVPFEKIIDEPTDVTKHIIDDGCTVIPAEYQSEFDPPPDLCQGVTCPPPANECEQAACNTGTGACDETAKPNGTSCNADANACTVGDSCQDGQCAPGTPKTCPEPAEQCKESDGCNPATGDCGIKNKTDGTACNDGNSDTENDQCVSGACEGTPIQVEPNPEQEPDVVEQDDTAESSPEPDTDIVEQNNNEIVEGEVAGVEPGDDVIEVSPDVGEDGNDSGDVNLGDVNPDETNPDGVADAVDSCDSSGDAGGDASSDTSPDDDTDGKAENPDAFVDGKSPGGCGCETNGRTPNNPDGILLLGMLAAGAGLIARSRDRIRSALNLKS